MLIPTSFNCNLIFDIIHVINMYMYTTFYWEENKSKTEITYSA